MCFYLYRRYAFAIPLKDKKGISIVNAFNKIIKQSNRKPSKIWVDQGGEFYNNVFEKWPQIMILICIQRIMKVNQ